MSRWMTHRAAIVVGALSGIIALIVVALLVDRRHDSTSTSTRCRRVEQVRSSTPISAYLDGPAPIPPGWVLALWSVFEVVPPRRPLLRAGAAIFAVPTAIALALTLRTMLRRLLDDLSASIVAVGATVMALTTTAIAVHAVYFNNYLADLAVAAAMLLLLVRIDLERADDTTTWVAVVVLATVAPWFAQTRAVPRACRRADHRPPASPSPPSRDGQWCRTDRVVGPRRSRVPTPGCPQRDDRGLLVVRDAPSRAEHARTTVRLVVRRWRLSGLDR